MDASREVRFAGWTLDRSAGELLRGETRVRLQGQPLQVLEALLARPGELVSREELISQLWPKRIVDYDTALNSAVRRLRAALQDDTGEPRCIETIPRRGYRFIAAIEPVASAAPATPVDAVPGRPRSSPVRLTVGFALLLLAGIGVALLQDGDDPDGQAAQSRQASPEVTELSQRARHLLQRRDPGDIALARKYFNDAVGIDPQHAEGWAGLASAYWLGTVTGELPPEQGLSHMRDAAERALAIDPGLAEPHVRLAAYRWTTGDTAKRDAHLRRALELNPQDPLVLGVLAIDAAETGQFELAARLQQQAVAADPLSIAARFNLASILYMAGRFEESTEVLVALRELNPATTRIGELLGTLLVLQGRFDEALDIALESEDEDRLFVSALALHGLGRLEDSKQAAIAVADMAGDSDPLRLAELWAWLGRNDAAFERLEHAVAQSPARPWHQVGRRRPWMMRYSPLLEPLHADPRWEQWLAQH